jgi:hypothetical protein
MAASRVRKSSANVEPIGTEEASARLALLTALKRRKKLGTPANRSAKNWDPESYDPDYGLRLTLATLRALREEQGEGSSPPAKRATTTKRRATSKQTKPSTSRAKRR